MAVLTLKGYKDYSDSTSFSMDRITVVDGSTAHVQMTGYDMMALSWDGVNLTEQDRMGLTDAAFSLLETSYVHSNTAIVCKTGDPDNGFWLRRLSFNGSYTLEESYDWTTEMPARTLDRVAIDASYLYTTDADDVLDEVTIRAFSVDPITQQGGTLIGTGPNYYTVSMFVGNYIYVLTTTILQAYSFNGTSFDLVGGASYALPGAYGAAFKVWYDGNYIYVITNDTGSGTPGVLTITFNGSAFTLASVLTPIDGQGAVDVWGAGGYVFIPNGSDTQGSLQIHQRGSTSYTFKEKNTDALGLDPYQDPLAVSGTSNLLFMTSYDPRHTPPDPCLGRIWVYQFEALTSSVTKLDTRFLKISSTAPGIEDDGAHALRVKVKTEGGMTLDGDGLSVDKSQINEFIIVEHVLSSSEITARQFTLLTPMANTNQVDLVVLGGLPQNFGADYTSVSPTIIGWDGLGLDGTVEEGDELRVTYSV